MTRGSGLSFCAAAGDVGFFNMVKYQYELTGGGQGVLAKGLIASESDSTFVVRPGHCNSIVQ